VSVKSQAWARLMQERVARGLCRSCREEKQSPCVPGKSQCESCLAKAAEYARKKRATRSAAGLCTECGVRRRERGRRKCRRCREEFREYMREYDDRRYDRRSKRMAENA
jgi:hypothetical protein